VLPQLNVGAVPSEAMSVEVKTPRLLSFAVLLVGGLLLFELAFFAFKSGKPFQIATFIGLPVAYSAIAALLRSLLARVFLLCRGFYCALFHVALG